METVALYSVLLLRRRGEPVCFFGVCMWTDLREWSAAVIRVRRRDFVSGSHNVTGFQGIVERVPRGVTIYLLPGPDQSASAGRSSVGWRQEASRGCGPELPLAQLLIALLLDRVPAGRCGSRRGPSGCIRGRR